MPEYSFARAAGSAFRTQHAGGLLGGHRCSPRRPFANVSIALVPPVSDAGLQEEWIACRFGRPARRSPWLQ